MDALRTRRLLFFALTILFAGVLALPAKLVGGPLRQRLTTADGSRSLARSAPAKPPQQLPPPPPVLEHPIQAPDEGGAPINDTIDLGPLPPVQVPADLSQIATPSAGTAGNVFAVVVGINDYPGSASDLRGAVDDADDMTAALALNGVPATNMVVLRDREASAGAIVSALQWLTGTAGPGTTAVVFYAGHVRKLGPTTEAIVGADGVVLPDTYLADQLDGLQSRDTWIVMAACYGGGFTELVKPGRILTAASDANSLAYENESFGRSYLDEYLVNRALLQKQASVPTAQAAFEFAQAGLQRDYPDRTLTEVDESVEPISLDGVPRSGPPPPSAPNQGGGGQPPPPPNPSPAPSPGPHPQPPVPSSPAPTPSPQPGPTPAPPPPPPVTCKIVLLKQICG